MAARSIKIMWVTFLSSRLLVIGAVGIQHGVLYYRPEPIDSISYYQSLDLDRCEQQYCDTINRTILVRYDSTFIKVRNVLVRISASYSRLHNSFSPGNNVQKQFVYDKSAEQFPHLNTL
ncbi:hypothetical protein TNCV_5056971 [Trichonephila clavipes]|nr:hypothetical protein TNCV_5056971 [Trichonephila clavipes]